MSKEKKEYSILRDPKILATPGKKIKISDYNPFYTGIYTDKASAMEKLKKDIRKLSALQDRLYAHDRFSILLIFQALDAAGKDGTIKHVMTGVNPQGCQVFSFKAPSAEELDHNYLWRFYKALPERGRIGIFNRSYYEETLVVKVHPQILLRQQLPDISTLDGLSESFWKKRYEQMNDFEKGLYENGTITIKFFLNVSKEEQRRRFLERIENPDKNWKFTMNDITERNHWNEYMDAFEQTIRHTSTSWAPWYIIPADNKWFMRLAVCNIIVNTLKNLNPTYPEVGEDKLKAIEMAKEILQNEESGKAKS
jgi:PPK2 family polyphosphate:nucleotide phosphotransferase